MAASPTSLSPAAIQQLLAGPAISAPPGQTSNLNAANPQGTSVVICMSITFAISFLALVARLLTEWFIASGLVVEDFCIILACMFQIAAMAVGLVNAEHGIGKHMWDVTLQTFIDTSKRTYVYSPMYTLSTMFIKMAILLQFIRIFTPSRINKPAWYTCWTVIIVNSVFDIIQIFLQFFQCSPIAKQWNPLLAGHCLSLLDVYHSGAIVNMITDFMTLLIPIPLIIRLNMSPRKKLAIAAVFATGIFACVASVIRFHYTQSLFVSPDTTYIISHLAIWCSIELSAGIVIFCVPILPQLYYFMVKTVKGSEADLSKGSSTTARELRSKPTREQYEMPSLASFEEGSERSKTPNHGYSLSSDRYNRSSSTL